ncbi:hypothetical protein [Terrilactibacillus laevilacticus]|uniref:Uncharacterized protein n=1 Tax=Terrilactibacillus laevilacticus TaxID=1380157 RepID=A0ABW5PL68_9BACI|nr:hypothetical protein [Terrilactibacillus laevilacticus]
MSRNKKILAAFLIIVFIGVFSYHYVIERFAVSSLTRTEGRNPAHQKILGSGNYVVGKGIDQGYYDIQVIEGNLVVSGDELEANNTLHAIPYWNNNKIWITGKGKVEFSPSSFSRLKKEDDHYIISESGYYVVGSEIPSGKYQIILTDSTIPVDVFIDIKNNKNESYKSIQWDKKKKAHSHILYLKKGFQLYVDKKDEGNHQAEKVKIILKEIKS